jgi:hypothetical protein
LSSSTVGAGGVDGVDRDIAKNVRGREKVGGHQN